MFLNPLWSLLLLCVCIALYVFIVRPRLRAKYADAYAALDGFWARVWFVVSTFKKTMVTIFMFIVTAAPDILANFVGVDFSSILPEGKAHLAVYTGPITLALIAALKKFDDWMKPKEG